MSTTWQTTYPTLAMVKATSFDTLMTWDENLPSPQTDVELTIRKRIKKRLFEKAASECREKAPDVADSWNDLMDKLKSMGARGTGRM